MTTQQANFLNLPRELRDKVYELCLLCQEPINPWNAFYLRQKLTIGLLHANKAVHHEASSMLYTQNCFDFTTVTSEYVASFLGTIGQHNADYIRHVYVEFPTFDHLEPGDITLQEDSIGILANIQSGCTNLRTLTTSLQSTNDMEIQLDALDNPEVAAEALTLVNTSFRAISSLQDIIIEAFEDGPSDDIRRKIKNHGWTVRTTENPEEWDSDRDLSNFDVDWDHDYGYDDDGDDSSYDIDNDSDYWRRMQD